MGSEDEMKKTNYRPVIDCPTKEDSKYTHPALQITIYLTCANRVFSCDVTVRFPAILEDSPASTVVVITRTRASDMASFCAVVGCSNRSNREKEKSFLGLLKSYTNRVLILQLLSLLGAS